MAMILECDEPGCTKRVTVDLLSGSGRLTLPPGWWLTSGRRTVVACCSEHLITAVAFNVSEELRP